MPFQICDEGLNSFTWFFYLVHYIWIFFSHDFAFDCNCCCGFVGVKYLGQWSFPVGPRIQPLYLILLFVISLDSIVFSLWHNWHKSVTREPFMWPFFLLLLFIHFITLNSIGILVLVWMALQIFEGGVSSWSFYLAPLCLGILFFMITDSIGIVFIGVTYLWRGSLYLPHLFRQLYLNNLFVISRFKWDSCCAINAVSNLWWGSVPFGFFITPGYNCWT